MIDTVSASSSSETLLHRWGVAMAVHRRVVLAVWAALLVACAVAYPILEGRLGGMNFGVDDSESAEVDRLLNEHFPHFGTEQDVIVFSSTATADSPKFRAAVERTLAAAQQIPGVRGVLSPYGAPGQVSRDGRVALAFVGIDGDMAQRADVARTLQDAVRASAGDGVDAAVTGYSPVQNDATELQKADLQRAELIGIPVALGLLVIAMAALVAAIIPIGIALAGLLLAAGALLLASTMMSFDSLVMSMATMIGVGVGIDYAMFIVSRFREELHRAGVVSRHDHDQIAFALARSLTTAGKTVLASGIIVMISLCSLLIMEAPVFRGIALGVAIAVISTLIVGMTLLPALLATLGPAINTGALPRRLSPAEIAGSDTPTEGGWARWAHIMMRRPLIASALAAAVLLVAAAPLLGIRYGLDMGTSALHDQPSGRATATLAQNFPAGTLSAIEMVATGPGDTPLTAGQAQRARQFIEHVSRDPRIDTVLPTEGGEGRLLVTAVPRVAFDSVDADALVRNLRTNAADAGRDDGPTILIGGSSAEFVDLADEMTAKLPLVIALVLVCSLVFLFIAFRSVALPLKAILMNLLATGAALGITVAVFQWGIGEAALDFTSPGFVQVYLPTVVFAVLFGLSMDYEVFLIRRIREFWDSTGDNEHAVAAGLSNTARPITAAAAIMVAIFGSFVTANILELKQIGFALALAVAIDAVIIRLILVPALMRILGQWNWWVPSVGGRVATTRGRSGKSGGRRTSR